MIWPNWMRFSLRSLLFVPLLVGSLLALNHNWAPWYLERKLVGHAAEVRSAALAPDGRSVITAGADTTARIWNTQSGLDRIVYSGSASFLVTARFSPDGRLAAFAGFDQSVIVLDVEKSIILGIVRHEPGHACSAIFSPDGRDLLALFSDGKILSFDTQKKFLEPRFSIDTTAGEFFGASYSRDGKMFASFSFFP